MKPHLNCLTTFLVAMVIATSSFSQSVPFPTNPPSGEIGPWGYEQVGTSWDTSPYLPFKYAGTAYRLMPPNGVTYAASSNTWSYDEPEKKYPIILFFHGKGESGQDNNNQLKHGGQRHRDAVLSDEFPGYLLYPQNGTAQDMKGILDKMVADGYPIDLSRVYVHGLSRGAKWGWDFVLTYPHAVAAFWPMSGINPRDYSDIIYTPIRIAQGSLDQNPTPSASLSQYEEIVDLGGQMEYFLLDGVGHGTWNYMYNRSDFFSWFLSHSVNTIYAKYDYYEVCPEDPIDVVLGVNPGWEGYEWRKDGVLMDGESTHELYVDDFGDYTVRVMINGEWTDWSAVKTVGERSPTQTPPVETVGSFSTVLPDPNGNSTIELTLPDGYENYEWYRDGSLVGSAQTIDAIPGVYTALVQEKFGCSSEFSEPFIVLENSGVGVPDAPVDLTVETLSKTSLGLTWENVAGDAVGIELYMRESIKDDFDLIEILSPDQTSYSVVGLSPGTTYLFSLRGINENGASELTAEVSGLTDSDQINPSTPLNLRLIEANDYSVSLDWDESTDDVGIARYEIYQNGVLALTSLEATAQIYNLIKGTIYEFRVRAVDLAGNKSPHSDRVIVSPVTSGLNYKYYEGSYSNLPDFNSLTPVAQGISDNVDISYRLVNDDFAFLWEGKINIPVAGNYTFETYSDDGSKLYIGGYDEAYLVVDNDGLHGSTYEQGTHNFPAPGSYDIVISFFERGGGETMKVYWKNTAHGVVSRELIPSEAFSEEMIIPDETVEAPSGLVGVSSSTSEISLTWTDNSDNEVNFQLYRADLPDLTFVPIALLASNSTSYVDSGLDPDSEYMYKVVAVGQYSQSSEALTLGPIYQLELDSELLDLSGNSVGTNTYGNVQFSASEKVYGAYSAEFDGSGSYLNIDNGDQFIHKEFTQRSVSFWIKPASTSGIQDVFDEGGSTNGIALRINNGAMELSTQDNHNMVTVSGAIDASEWTQVTGVFDNGTLQLYLNGVLVDENTSVGYSDVSSHGDGGGLGATNGSNAFDAVNNNFVGWIDEFFMFDSALDESDVTALVDRVNDETITTVRTMALPQPSDPLKDFASEILGATSVSLSWASADVIGYQVLRSDSEDSGYRMIAFLSPDDTTYVDSSLEVHTDYYYYVRSRISTGYSESSDTLAISIPNYLPELVVAIADTSIYYDDSYTLLLVATDAEGDVLSFSSPNLPSFIQLNDMSNNSAQLVVEPGATDFGDFADIEIILSDGYDQVSNFFDLEVVSNFAPVIDSISTYSMSGGETLQVTLTGSDSNGDGITWSIDDLPSFGQITSGVNSETLVLEFAPDEVLDGGVHNIEVVLRDDNVINALETTALLELTVIPLDESYKVYISFGDGLVAPSPWNSFQYGFPAQDRQFTDIVNEDGFALPIVINLDTRWTGSSNTGGVSNSIYGDDAGKSYFYTSESETLTISGLDPTLTYNFDLFGSRNATGDLTSVYTIGAQSESLQASGNTDQIVEIDGVAPSASGEIVLEVSVADGASNAYINAMVIEAVTFTGGAAPLAPSDLSATVDGTVNISWKDNSFNEEGFRIYRSLVLGSDAELVATLEANETSYSDVVSITAIPYFYSVEAFNSFGSETSEEFKIFVPNLAPYFTVYPEEIIELSAEGTLSIPFEAQDSPSDHIDFILENAPAFLTLIDNGDGTCNVLCEPLAEDFGTYEDIVLKATDGQLLSSVTFDLDINPAGYERFFVNVTSASSSPSPWNTMSTNGDIGTGISGLVSEAGVSSSVSISLLDEWRGNNSDGMTGGVFPQEVTTTSIWESSTAGNRILISGLDTDKVYTIGFFASRDGGGERIAEYSVGNATVSLDASYNTDEIVYLNNLLPNSSGEIEVTVSKRSSSTYAYLNALIIEGVNYTPGVIEDDPIILEARGISGTAIQLDWVETIANEDEIEVWRSLGSETNYSLIASLGANTATYVDNSIVSNQLYFYKVRTKTGTDYSDFSNSVNTSSILFTVLLNFNPDTPEASPWNNVNQAPYPNLSIMDLTNTLGQNTGFTMTLPESNPDYPNFGFVGDNPFGMVTGDNSGVVPDNVMRSTFWMDPGMTAEVVFGGVSLAYRYSFEFFASRDGGGNRTTDYTIDDTTVSLNAAYNTSETVIINNVVPDSEAEVHVFASTNPSATYGYLGAVMIYAYLSDPSSSQAKMLADKEDAIVDDIQQVSVYPNPFRDYLTINTNNLKELKVLDVQGRVVYSEGIFEDLSEIQIDGSNLNSGLYILQLVKSDGSTSVHRLIKK